MKANEFNLKVKQLVTYYCARIKIKAAFIFACCFYFNQQIINKQFEASNEQWQNSAIKIFFS